VANVIAYHPGSTRIRATKWMLAGLASMALLFALGGARATAAESPEASAAVARQVKAAYLYKFGNYVEWPGSAFVRPDSPIVIGVAGDDALAASLARVIVGKRIQGRGLEVRRVDVGQRMTGVHILFVGRMDADSLAGVVHATRGQPVLVVSDAAQAAALDSMVSFVVVDQRLRFKVALEPVASNGLKLSALMLTVAYQVKREAP
jgi:hypothetical protein